MVDQSAHDFLFLILYYRTTQFSSAVINLRKLIKDKDIKGIYSFNVFIFNYYLETDKHCETNKYRLLFHVYDIASQISISEYKEHNKI